MYLAGYECMPACVSLPPDFGDDLLDLLSDDDNDFFAEKKRTKPKIQLRTSRSRTTPPERDGKPITSDNKKETRQGDAGAASEGALERPSMDLVPRPKTSRGRGGGGGKAGVERTEGEGAEKTKRKSEEGSHTTEILTLDSPPHSSDASRLPGSRLGPSEEHLRELHANMSGGPTGGPMDNSSGEPPKGSKFDPSRSPSKGSKVNTSGGPPKVSKVNFGDTDDDDILSGLGLEDDDSTRHESLPLLQSAPKGRIATTDVLPGTAGNKKTLRRLSGESSATGANIESSPPQSSSLPYKEATGREKAKERGGIAEEETEEEGFQFGGYLPSVASDTLSNPHGFTSGRRRGATAATAPSVASHPDTTPRKKSVRFSEALDVGDRLLTPPTPVRERRTGESAEPRPSPRAREQEEEEGSVERGGQKKAEAEEEEEEEGKGAHVMGERAVESKTSVGSDGQSKQIMFGNLSDGDGESVDRGGGGGGGRRPRSTTDKLEHPVFPWQRNRSGEVSHGRPRPPATETKAERPSQVPVPLPSTQAGASINAHSNPPPPGEGVSARLQQPRLPGGSQEVGVALEGQGAGGGERWRKVAREEEREKDRAKLVVKLEERLAREKAAFVTLQVRYVQLCIHMYTCIYTYMDALIESVLEYKEMKRKTNWLGQFVTNFTYM